MLARDPLSYTVKDACALTGLSRTTMYEVIKAGVLSPRKCGNRTLILHEDLQAFLHALPSKNNHAS